MAAIAITLCDVVVFAPVAFLSDLVGQFFRQFGLTVVFATLFSLFVSFTMTPALASRLLGREPERARKAARAEGAPASPRKRSFFDTQGQGRLSRGPRLGPRPPRPRCIGVVAAPLRRERGPHPPRQRSRPSSCLPSTRASWSSTSPWTAAPTSQDRRARQGRSRPISSPCPRRSRVFSQVGTDAGPNYAELTVKLKDKREALEEPGPRRPRAAGLGRRPARRIDFSVTEPSIIDQTSVGRQQGPDHQRARPRPNGDRRAGLPARGGRQGDAGGGGRRQLDALAAGPRYRSRMDRRGPEPVRPRGERRGRGPAHGPRGHQGRDPQARRTTSTTSILRFQPASGADAPGHRVDQGCRARCGMLVPDRPRWRRHRPRRRARPAHQGGPLERGDGHGQPPGQAPRRGHAPTSSASSTRTRRPRATPSTSRATPR